MSMYLRPVRNRRHRGFRAALLLLSASAAFLTIDIGTAVAQIETVVVTARKREENVQNIPVAVSVLSGEQLQNYNMTSLEKVSASTPQLIIARGSSGSGADISLRGIGSSSENIGIEQSVAVDVDGIYYGQGRAINEGLFDAKSVQILKGPQALFFGKNASAGVIAIDTQDPGNSFEAMGRVGYEFNSEMPYVEAIASGPVTDTLGVRLAVHTSIQDQGYVVNNAGAGTYHTTDAATFQSNSYATPTPNGYLGQEKSNLARLTAKWEPMDGLSVTFKGTFNDYNTNNNSINVINTYCELGNPQLENFAAGYGQDPPAHPHPCGKHWVSQQNAVPFAVAATGGLEGNRNGNDFQNYQSYTLVANATYVTPKVTVSSANAYQHLGNSWTGDQDYTAVTEVMAGERFAWKQFSSEERVLTTLDSPVNFAGGAYFQTTQLNFLQDVIFLGSQNTAAANPENEFVSYKKDSATTGQTYAVFGQAIWDIMPELQLTGGVRFTHELKGSYFFQPYVNPFLTGLFTQFDPNNPKTIVKGHQTFDNLSPEAMLTWKPSDTLTVYGGWKRGFKSGGFSDSAILSTLASPGDFFFKPEKAQGYEAGVKSLWLDDQLRANFDIFNYLYTDLQVDFFNTPTFNYITLNAASARTKGAELEVEYAPKSIAGLVVHAQGAYNESHYGEFIAPCSPAGLSYEEGCTEKRIVNADGSYTFSSNCGTAAVTCDFMNVSGRPTALAPTWTGSVQVDYNRAIGNGLVAGLSSNFRLSSSYVANGFPSGVAQRVDRQSAYGMIDAALRVGSEANDWQVALIGRNLTDTFVAVGTQGLPLSGGTTGCKVSSCGPQLHSDQGSIVLPPRTLTLEFTYKY